MFEDSLAKSPDARQSLSKRLTLTCQTDLKAQAASIFSVWA
jgi:hypothetical protein